jgi:hypothetical protein
MKTWNYHQYLTLILIFLSCHSLAQKSHSINVFFLYGSKPALEYKKIETREFGGIHGGHVSIGIDSFNVSFHHVNGFHVFSRRKKLKGMYEQIPITVFLRDTVGRKYAVITIPLDSIQYENLKKTISSYILKTPYDYAFFGMRCAAAAYEMLSTASVFRSRSRLETVCLNFYPRLLRKKLVCLAMKKKYAIHRQNGILTRTWETD